MSREQLVAVRSFITGLLVGIGLFTIALHFWGGCR